MRRVLIAQPPFCGGARHELHCQSISDWLPWRITPVSSATMEQPKKTQNKQAITDSNDEPGAATRLASTRARGETLKRASAKTLARSDNDPMATEIAEDVRELAQTLLSESHDLAATKVAEGGNAAGDQEAATRVSSAQSQPAQSMDATLASNQIPTTVNAEMLVEAHKQRVDEQNQRHRKYAGKKILKDRFVLERVLGSGGMGNVYLAIDLLREEMEDSDHHIAIKVLNEACRRMPGALQSLQREAKKAQVLSHPNIVTVFDFDKDGDTAFITMEYIKGYELKDFLRKNPRMSFKKALYVVERVARGLAYAHQQGFSHSDIKPANVFLAEDGSVKILDFGIAKAFGEARKEKRTAADDLTEGALTPAYASLEMLEGDMALPGDDVYSLSVMAYEMISGHHPFLDEEGMPLPANIAQAKGFKVEPIPNVPRRYMRVLRKGLAFERDKRFADAGKFIDAIKPRKLKNAAIMISSAALITGVVLFAADQLAQQVVPSVGSLKPELVEVGETIIEADSFMKTGDVDMAHRLYSQAWEVANDLTMEDVVERERVASIISDRMNDVSDFLIERASAPDIDEYSLRELYVALEFLQKDEIAGNEKAIDKALARIQKRIDKLQSE